MDKIQDRVNKLDKIYNYRFKFDVVKSILKEFKTEFKKSIFDKAVEIDKKKHPVYIEFEKLIGIIDNYIQNDKFKVKFTPENIRDGYGNIAVSFNGNPYVTMNLVLMALRTHNNIIFFSKKYYAINSIIVQTLNKICKKKNYVNEMSLVEFGNCDDIIFNQSLFDLMLYIGDKREYQKYKRKINLKTIFYGYDYVDVFIESKEFKNILLDIDKYANKNDITINYFDNTSYEETFEFMNKYEVSDCFVLFSKNTDTVYKFISNFRVNRFYINQNPFDNYEFDFDEKKLVYNKKIFLKKM